MRGRGRTAAAPRPSGMIAQRRERGADGGGHGGGGEQEGRDWTRRKSITSNEPAMNPPQEASDFENVAHPQVDAVLDPEQLGGPGAARAEHARTVRLVDHQPRAVAPAQLGDARQVATSPSIEKTPSTTTSTPPPSPAARSSASRACRAGCGGTRAAWRARGCSRRGSKRGRLSRRSPCRLARAASRARRGSPGGPS